jgi:hypothetical protein
VVFRDAVGNVLSEGDSVSFALGLGQSVSGKVVKLSSGLGAPNTPQGSPTVYIACMLDLQATPSGMVGGIFKIASPSSVEVG